MTMQFTDPKKTFAESVKHVINVNPNLRARIVPTPSLSKSDLDLYELKYVDEVGSGFFEYRRIFGEWDDHYGKFIFFCVFVCSMLEMKLNFQLRLNFIKEWYQRSKHCNLDVSSSSPIRH